MYAVYATKTYTKMSLSKTYCLLLLLFVGIQVNSSAQNSVFARVGYGYGFADAKLNNQIIDAFSKSTPIVLDKPVPNVDWLQNSTSFGLEKRWYDVFSVGINYGEQARTVKSTGHKADNKFFIQGFKYRITTYSVSSSIFVDRFSVGAALNASQLRIQGLEATATTKASQTLSDVYGKRPLVLGGTFFADIRINNNEEFYLGIRPFYQLSGNFDLAPFKSVYDLQNKVPNSDLKGSFNSYGILITCFAGLL
jgi:hypothetical protein